MVAITAVDLMIGTKSVDFTHPIFFKLPRKQECIEFNENKTVKTGAV